MPEAVLQNLTAIAHPAGNRVDLVWTAPEGASFDGVLIRRSTAAYPGHPDDGILVASVTGQSTYTDDDLKAETVYYYSLFPYRNAPPKYYIDRRNVISAMATGPYGNAGQMYDLLPRIYHRYDTVLPSQPEKVAEEDRDKGQLRRFLDVVGGELDRLQSSAKALLAFHDPNRLEGSLLPLLAQWIGWDTDFRLKFSSQRNEISNAPFLYERIGIIPTVEATVKRLIGWESRTKEFFGNVFLANRPEQLNIRCITRSGGKWEAEDKLISLDFNYDGRASMVACKDGKLRLFYHTKRGDCWNIWQKKSDGKGGWTPSVPVLERTGIDKYATAACNEDTTWVFWNAYDEISKTWCILSRKMEKDRWQKAQEFPGKATSRRLPAACADADKGFWLFWVEETSLKYRKYDNSWNVADVLFPDDGGKAPTVDADPFVLPLIKEKALYVFWARRINSGDRKIWNIAYRKKADLSKGSAGWGPVKTLPNQPDRDDREPAAVLNENGNIELFWSSNRSGNWLIWSSVLSDPANNVWSAPSQVMPSDYSQRAPLPMTKGTELSLFFGSNKGVQYQSSVYTATETIDIRYAGSTTFDLSNARKNHLTGDFRDFVTYTYDIGKSQSDWYARDTVGIYLTPDTENQELINRNISRLSFALSKFLPAQIRPVFIIEAPVYREYVYSKDPDKGKDIEAHVYYTLESTADDAYEWPKKAGAYTDTLPDWIWITITNAVTGEFIDHRTANLSKNPPVTKYRVQHAGINKGG